MTRFEPVIGLEVHCQLGTLSKLFCACANTFGAPPSTLACETCSGQPGALPALNGEALDLALRAALALGCELAERVSFDRKHYSYCDLPKGFQITQARTPLGTGGSLELSSGKHVRIERLHIEEDAAKILHRGGESFVDLNRAGVPLVECVTAPEFASAAEARDGLERLRELLVFVGAGECDMERGSLRCDVNVSLRAADGALGERVEIKNLNSFVHVHDALAHELARQRAMLEGGRAIARETRLWDAERGETRPMREKEGSAEYRWLPEADLPEFALDRARVARLAACLPEPPASRRRRYVEELRLDRELAEVVLESPASSDFFEAALKHSRDPRAIASWMANELRALLRERAHGIAALEELPFKPFDFAELVELASSGRASRPAARTILREMLRSPRAPRELLRALGLERIEEGPELDELCQRALEARPEALADLRAGKLRALEALLGAALALSGGRAHPDAARATLVRLVREQRP